MVRFFTHIKNKSKIITKLRQGRIFVLRRKIIAVETNIIIATSDGKIISLPQ